ncbi:MAG: membrane lipoprotein lipid attachment site-containing protein, partial [Bacteroidales bacterium]|nr:membrane lipoprotein lipid attachment site-containing protein [Bacteroidales bacterium]
MKKILFILLSVLLVAGCGKSKKATLKLNVDNLQEGKVVVSVLDINKMNVVDTLTLKKGEAAVKLDLPDESPNFFYVSYNG